MSRRSDKALVLALVVVIVGLLILLLRRNQPNGQTVTSQHGAAPTEPLAVTEPVNSSAANRPTASAAPPAGVETAASASSAPISDADCNAVRTKDPELVRQHLESLGERKAKIATDVEEAESIGAQVDGFNAHIDDLGRMIAQLRDRAHKLPAHDAGMLLATEGAPIAAEEKRTDEAAIAAMNRLLTLDFEVLSASDKATLDGCYLGHAFDENLALRTVVANGVAATRIALKNLAGNLAEADSFLSDASRYKQ